jgi:hypothetical protein
MCRKRGKQLNDFAVVQTYFAPDVSRRGLKPAAHHNVVFQSATGIMGLTGVLIICLRARRPCPAGWHGNCEMRFRVIHAAAGFSGGQTMIKSVRVCARGGTFPA